MKILRLSVAALITFTVVFTVCFGKTKIGEDKTVKEPKSEKQIISVWQIDSFEGGSGSRRGFLSEVARKFEKNNDEILIMVTSHTAESAKNCTDNGIIPDLISYGNGTEIASAAEINVRDGSNEKNIKGTLAAVWCRGIYVLFENRGKLSKNHNELTVSQGEYTLPLAAYALDGKVSNGVIEMSPLDAYVNFVGGKSKYLLGTQRDVVRMINRGFSAEITPIGSFCDLNQYISLTSTDAQKAVYAERYVNYLLSDEIQKSLYKINMFSAYVNVEYEEEVFLRLQSVVPKKGVSAFVSKERIKELQELSRLAANGEESSLLKIKKVLL